MIKLKQIMPIDNPEQYKLHSAKWNGSCEPLDDFILDWNNWVGWNKSWHSRNDFSRDYVISFIHFYPQPGTFLFGGIFKVLAVHKGEGYDVELCEKYKDFIGRLKVRNINTSRGRAFNFEKHYENIEVVELLDKSYSTQAFPGYERIDFPFEQIKKIIENNVSGWKTALENVKGVYMLTDSKTGKRYIGSAYGDSGVWSRWSQYCENGHGGNKQLRELVDREGFEYVEKNFKFTLLEMHPMFKPDDYIFQRESYWKKVMMTREKETGYNSN